MEEIWKYIKEYPNYMISSYGRIKSLGNNKTRKEKILKPKKKRNGYLQVHLSKNGKLKSFQIHRLVAEAFIPNPNNYPQINHKDENKGNNVVSNLEWCTAKYNSNYGSLNERKSQTLKGNTNQKKRCVLQYTINGDFIKEYFSIKEAENETNIAATNIGKCCRGLFKQMGGFKWRYKEESAA